jgi:hypothetical protein
MPQIRSEGPAPQDSPDPDRDDPGRDVWRYRRACQEVDRLLDQGRLSEAIAVNEEVRALFRRLHSGGVLG